MILGTRQSGRHFSDDNFRYILRTKFVVFWSKFVSTGLTDSRQHRFLSGIGKDILVKMMLGKAYLNLCMLTHTYVLSVCVCVSVLCVCICVFVCGIFQCLQFYFNCQTVLLPRRTQLAFKTFNHMTWKTHWQIEVMPGWVLIISFVESRTYNVTELTTIINIVFIHIAITISVKLKTHVSHDGSPVS